MNTTDAVQIVAVLLLSALFFLEGILANVKGLYWGRTGKDWPALPFQQRILGLTWGSALLVLAAKMLIVTVKPQTITEVTSEKLTTILIGSCMVTTFIVGLLDSRAQAAMRKDRTGRFFFVFGWLMVTLMSGILVWEVWSVTGGSPVTLKYSSGIEIKKGDRVLLHGEPGEIEFVASEPGDPETDWYIQEYGGGVMVLEPKVMGSVFIAADQLEASELEFVARAKGK